MAVKAVNEGSCLQRKEDQSTRLPANEGPQTVYVDDISVSKP